MQVITLLKFKGPRSGGVHCARWQRPLCVIARARLLTILTVCLLYSAWHGDIGLNYNYNSNWLPHAMQHTKLFQDTSWRSHICMYTKWDITWTIFIVFVDKQTWFTCYNIIAVFIQQADFLQARCRSSLYTSSRYIANNY